MRVAVQVDELADDVAEVLIRKGDYSGCPVVRLLHDRHHPGPVVRATHLELHDVPSRHAVCEHRDPDQPRQSRLDLFGVQLLDPEGRVTVLVDYEIHEHVHDFILDRRRKPSVLRAPARRPSCGARKATVLRIGADSEDSVLVDGVEKLVVEPHHLGRRQRLTLTAAVLALLTFTLLTGDSLTPACGQQPDHPRPTASAHPWIAPDDPRVDRLHYRVLDRTPTANDRPPPGVLPDDVQAAARRVGDVAGATLYLAVGPGFACLGANRISVYDNAYHPAAAQHSVCLLNSTIVNQGLTLTFTPEGSEDGVVVVAVPDGYNLITTPSATRLAAYPNVDALRPGPDPIYLQPPEGTLVDLRVNQDEITSFAC